MPVPMKSASTRFSLLAQSNVPMGVPICLAYQAARMSPKLPVGTQTLSLSPFSSGRPASSFPARTSSA